MTIADTILILFLAALATAVGAMAAILRRMEDKFYASLNDWEPPDVLGFAPLQEIEVETGSFEEMDEDEHRAYAASEIMRLVRDEVMKQVVEEQLDDGRRRYRVLVAIAKPNQGEEP